MIINKIALENFGVFFGQHDFILNPNGKSKPIILFGGMNGSGKTTVFDAIRLCLYGPHVLKQRRNGNYNEYLKSKIHNSNDLVVQPNHASIEIEFQYSKYGQKSTYIVERSWEIARNKMIEHLIVQRDGKNIDEVERDNWQEFINELIPIGLSRLFFFDGEKIQKMMSADNDIELKNSVKALIGLDLIERLNADLKIYRTRHLKKISSSQINEEREIYENQLNLINDQIQEVHSSHTAIISRISDVASRIEKREKTINAQGGWYLDNRDKLQKTKLSLEKDIEGLKENLREICAGLLPISIASQNALKLKKQIDKDNEIQTNRISSRILKKKALELKKEINRKDFLTGIEGLKTPKQKCIQNKIVKEIDKLFVYSNPNKNARLILGLSQKQSSEVLYEIEQALTIVPVKLKDVTKKYEQKYRKLQKVLMNLQRVPDEEMFQPMYEKLNELNKGLGALENEKLHLDEEINRLEIKRNEIERKLVHVEMRQKENRKTDKKLMLVNETENALSLYLRDIAKLKCRHLTVEFTNIFSKLHRKKDMLNRIDINPETFNISLFNKSNRLIDKESLSSGEQEIYAMSMVWALAKTSGSNLPFIIDTPLGRLDSSHRSNLLNTFFPNASHQMVIFSTDTEIDKKNFHIMEPSVSRTYILEHDDHENHTQVKEGYFWS